MAKKKTNKPAAVKTLPAAGKKLSLEAYTEKAKQEIEDLVKDLLTDFGERYANAAPEAQKLLIEAELEYLEEHRNVLFELIYNKADIELYKHAFQIARRGIGIEEHLNNRYEKNLSSPVAEVFKEGYAMGIAVTHLKTKVSSGEGGKSVSKVKVNKSSKPFVDAILGLICNIFNEGYDKIPDRNSCKGNKDHCAKVFHELNFSNLQVTDGIAKKSGTSIDNYTYTGGLQRVLNEVNSSEIPEDYKKFLRDKISARIIIQNNNRHKKKLVLKKY